MGVIAAVANNISGVQGMADLLQFEQGVGRDLFGVTFVCGIDEDSKVDVVEGICVVEGPDGG